MTSLKCTLFCTNQRTKKICLLCYKQAFSQKGVLGWASWDPLFTVDVLVYQNWTPSFRALAKSLVTCLNVTNGQRPNSTKQ